MEEQFCYNPKCFWHNDKIANARIEQGSFHVYESSVKLSFPMLDEYKPYTDKTLHNPQNKRLITRECFRFRNHVTFYCSDCIELLITKGFRL